MSRAGTRPLALALVLSLTACDGHGGGDSVADQSRATRDPFDCGDACVSECVDLCAAVRGACGDVLRTFDAPLCHGLCALRLDDDTLSPARDAQLADSVGCRRDLARRIAAGEVPTELCPAALPDAVSVCADEASCGAYCLSRQRLCGEGDLAACQTACLRHFEGPDVEAVGSALGGDTLTCRLEALARIEAGALDPEPGCAAATLEDSTWCAANADCPGFCALARLECGPDFETEWEATCERSCQAAIHRDGRVRPGTRRDLGRDTLACRLEALERGASCDEAALRTSSSCRWSPCALLCDLPGAAECARRALSLDKRGCLDACLDALATQPEDTWRGACAATALDEAACDAAFAAEGRCAGDPPLRLTEVERRVDALALEVLHAGSARLPLGGLQVELAVEGFAPFVVTLYTPDVLAPGARGVQVVEASELARAAGGPTGPDAVIWWSDTSTRALRIRLVEPGSGVVLTDTGEIVLDPERIGGLTTLCVLPGDEAFVLCEPTLGAPNAPAEVDCAAPGACAQPACQPLPRCQGEVCGNGIDDDEDGLVDCDDSECRAELSCARARCDTPGGCADAACADHPACRGEVCRDGFDDDGDGWADCADGECRGTPECTVEMHCADGLDDDGDGLVDCEDPGCHGRIECRRVWTERCDDGLDNDDVAGADCDDPACADHPSCRPGEEICDDGVRNAAFRRPDCADRSCREAPACAARLHITEIAQVGPGGVYVELHNPGEAPVDLVGWTLVLQTGEALALVDPGRWGGEPVEVAPGAWRAIPFESLVSLPFEARRLSFVLGGALLRDPDGVTMDVFEWAHTPATLGLPMEPDRGFCRCDPTSPAAAEPCSATPGQPADCP